MKRSNTTSLIVRLFVLVISLTLIGAALVVSAQNSNSSTAMQNSNTSATNTNRGGGRRARGRRRGRNAAATTNVTAGQGQEITTARPVSTGRCDPNTQVQADLSGTYTGTVNYADGGMNGDATLTINGTDFTLTSGSTTQEGRIVAETTCNYTGATMRFGKDVTVTPGMTPPSPPPTISVTAKKVGNGLTLTSAPGEVKQFSFTSTGGARRGGSRRARSVGIKPPTVSSTEPGTTPSTPATSAPARRGRRRATNAKTSNSNTHP